MNDSIEQGVDMALKILTETENGDILVFLQVGVI